MMSPRDALEITVARLTEAVEALQLEQRTNGWKESAQMVHAELKRQGQVQERHEGQLQTIKDDITNRLAAIQIAIVSAQNDTRNSLAALEQKVERAVASVGSSDVCKEHSRAIAQIEERVHQNAKRHDEAAQKRSAIWKELNKLRDWVKAVNDAGLVTHTEGRIRWSVVGIVAALGAIAGLGIGYLFLKLMGA